MTHTNMLSGRGDSAGCQNQQRHVRRCRPHAICFLHSTQGFSGYAENHHIQVANTLFAHNKTQIYQEFCLRGP